jgi:hypothetical protein
VAKLIVIWWRDIPSQVVVKQGREAAKVLLAHRFQEAIDRAAMRAGKASSDAYMADWRRSEPVACTGDMAEAAQLEATRLEGLYTDDDLLRIIRAHGVDESKPAAMPAALAPDSSQE